MILELPPKILLSNELSLDSIQYASQANAILGIRDSGKTYTATKIAEELFRGNIPFVAFDPIGVWRNLRVPSERGEGFPVVVAGDNADLELTVESAPHIVRAAMKGRVSLVLDLYSMKFSKADWKRIVESCVHLLLYENKAYGLRHIFLEEAAEFCPQRVGPDAGRVYAEIEKLARMGGNAMLGYTLINQRAEEVNKAVLELCDCLFLHRQKGRHSLTALGKWLDVADAEGSREIIKSLPTMPQGHCWVWQQGERTPKAIEVLPKRSLHPDRRTMEKSGELLKTQRQDITATLAQLRKHLALPTEVVHMNKLIKKDQAALLKAQEPVFQDYKKTMNNQDMVDKADYDDLKAKLEEERGKVLLEKAKVAALEKVIAGVQKALQPQYEALKLVFSEVEAVQAQTSTTDYSEWLDKLPGKNRRMLEVLIQSGPVTRAQLAFKAGMHLSGTFDTYLAKLKQLGLAEKNGDLIQLRQQ